MKKLLLTLLLTLCAADAVSAQVYAWRYRTHATDCTSLTDGKERDLCYEQDDQTAYKCVPSAGDCDTAGEWKQVSGTTLAEIQALLSSDFHNIGGTDDDVPESGDFGNAADLESTGALSIDVVAAAEMADADHGDISWTSGVASIDADSVALTTDTTGNYAAGDAEAGAATNIQDGLIVDADINASAAISASKLADNEIDQEELAATITFGATDLLDLSGIDASTTTEGLKLPQIGSACAAATAEGQICWDTVGDDLYVGDGTTAQQMNGGGGTPGGSDTQIQYNNGGAFGGITNIIWDDTNMEFADDQSLAFGTAGDWTINFDDSVDDQLLIATTNTAAIAATDPMIQILVGTTPSADQDVFGIAKGTQASNTDLFVVDEDGDLMAPSLANCDTIDTDANGIFSCGTDASGGGGTPNILDLGDDDSNESADLIEIATTGDTNSIFGEPTADKLLITVSNNWPTADAATTAGTVTTAAQPTITSVGTLTTLAVDNITINGNDITSTAGVDLNITPLAGQQLVLDGTVVLDAGVITGATSITSTAFVGDLTGNASGTAATVTTAAQPNITSLGTLTTLSVDNITINGNDISSTAGTDLTITPLAGQQIVLDGTIVVDAGVVTGATSITSTALVGALTGNADTATALAADPADCGANEFADAIAASGALTCNAIVDADVPDTITASNYLPLAGGATMTGSFITDNLGIEFEDSDTNPTCGAGEYKIYADLSETTFKKCMNGSATDLDTTGGTPALTDITDPVGATSLTHADTETITLTTSQNTAGSFLKIDNTVADVTGNVYLLTLEYTDTGDVDADFLQANDNNGTTVFSIQENGNTAITGTLDVDGATTLDDVTIDTASALVIPQGTGPTVNAAGEIAVDTTDDQLVYYGAAKRVVPYEREVTVTIENLADADDNFGFWIPQDNVTLVKAKCVCLLGTCTTESDLTLEHLEDGTTTVNAVTGTITCEDTTTGDTYTTLSGDNTVVGGDIVRFDATAPTPETDTYILNVVYTVDPQ